MRSLLIILFAIAFAFVIGCDGDGGGGDGDTAAAGDSAIPADGDAADDGDGAVGFWVTLLDTGGTITPGTHFIGGANAPGAGTLRCDYTWDAPPTNLTCWLEQYSGGSGSSGQVNGSSPLTITTHVDGGSWSPYILNSFTMPVYVRVKVYFMAD